jgi:hypothetical protein
VNMGHAGIRVDAVKYPKITKWVADMFAIPSLAGWIRREKAMLGLEW